MFDTTLSTNVMSLLLSWKSRTSLVMFWKVLATSAMCDELLSTDDPLVMLKPWIVRLLAPWKRLPGIDTVLLAGFARIRVIAGCLTVQVSAPVP
jgi:hypothetical protein